MIDCELPEFYTYSEPIARKEYDCCECDAPILKGEKHFHCRGKWDGAISSTCSPGNVSHIALSHTHG